MALPDVHVICGYAGGDGNTPDKQPIFKDPQWSEEPATGVATAKAATDKNGMRPVFRVTNKVDVYVALATANPNPAISPRYLLLAAQAPHDIYVKPSEKLAWVAA